MSVFLQVQAGNQIGVQAVGLLNALFELGGRQEGRHLL